MPSRSLLSVQEKLERRWRYVQEAEWMAITPAIRAYYEMVRVEPALRPVLNDLEDSNPEVQSALDEACRPRAEKDPPWRPSLHTCGGSSQAFAWALFRKYGADTSLDYSSSLVWLQNIIRYAVQDAHQGQAMTQQQMQVWKARFAVESYLRPLHEHLLDALDTNVETLAAIRWFQDWARWFGASRFEWETRIENERLEKRRNDEPDKAHKAQYEDSFQQVMFEKLFEYGLHFDTITREPKGPDGRPDFVIYTAIQRTTVGPRAIPVEAKIVDSRCDASTRFGFRQLRRYMDERHADAGYLVLFDTTPHGHQIDLADAPDGVPFIPLADQRRVYVVYVPTCQQLSASLDRKAAPARPGLTRAHFDEHAD